MIWKLAIGMLHQGLKLYKVNINDDPWLTLTYFTTRSNLVAYMFEWGKLLRSHLYEKINTPVGCLRLLRGYIHAYNHF